LDKETWAAFQKTVKRYRSFINKTEALLPGLSKHIQHLVNSREGPSYTVVTPVVYNEALDDIGAEGEIKMLLVGDNPGRREQETRRYLVGPSGKIAEKFFRDNPELGIDFRKNVLILNKTPIHTPRTADLKSLNTIGGKQVEEAVLSTQQVMAKLLYEFWLTLNTHKKSRECCEIWIIGYSEMKKNGIFEAYTETLKDLCKSNPTFKEHINFFRHFSMNQFTIDLKKRAESGESVSESLGRIGKMYRERVLDTGY